MKTQNPSKTPLKVYAGTVATLLILLFSVVLSFRAFNDLESANWWNTHTYKVLVETDEMSTAIANMQSASRGYLLARDKDFLELFYAGRASFDRHHENTSRLTRDNPTQQKRLQLLKRQYGIWLNGNILPLLKMSPEQLKAEVNSAQGLEGLRKRRVIANSIRQTISQIEAMENDLLVQRTQRQESTRNLTRTALLLNGGFAILLAGLLSSLLGKKTANLEASNQQLSREVAERTRAQLEAQILQHHNELILDSTKEGIVGMNMKGKITFVNAAAMMMLGHKEEQMLAKSVHDVLQPKLADGTAFSWKDSRLLSTLTTGSFVTVSDEVFCRGDHSCIPVEYTVTPLNKELEVSSGQDAEELWLSAKQERIGALLVFRDITRDKRAAAALEELAAIVRYSTDAVVGISLDGRVTSWNQAATQLYGYSLPIDQYFDKLEEPDTPQSIHSQLDEIRTGKAVEQFETRHIKNDGTTILVSITLSPIKNELDKVTGASAIIRKLS